MRGDSGQMSTLKGLEKRNQLLQLEQSESLRQRDLEFQTYFSFINRAVSGAFQLEMENVFIS